MRVLELTDLYRPAIGGLERFVELLAQTLAARGHEVHVVTAAVAGQEAVATAKGVTVHRLPLSYQVLGVPLALDAARPFHPPAPDPVFRRGLLRVARELRPDVVHAHSWSVHSSIRRSSSLPIMATAHDYGLVCAKKSLVDAVGDACPGPSLRRCPPCAAQHYGAVKGTTLALGALSSLRLLRGITKFTAVSDHVSQRLTPAVQRLTGKPVQTLHSFVPDGLFDVGWSTPRPGYLPEDGDFLLYVGQLSTHKGLTVLLDAYQRLSGPRPPLVLLGTEHPSFSPTMGLPSGVVLRTNVEHATVMAAMVRAACVVVPSLWPDPLPMTVSEAQNCAVPVVASAVGGIPEQVVDGVTGHLVPPGDAAALARRMGEVLGGREAARAMGEAARNHGRRFTASRGVEAVERALVVTCEEHAAAATALSNDRNNHNARFAR